MKVANIMATFMSHAFVKALKKNVYVYALDQKVNNIVCKEILESR